MARPKLGEGDTQRLQMKISEDELTAIDDWRFANRVESRSEAVRRLCQIGLIFDGSRVPLGEAVNRHGATQTALHNALVEELKVSGRYASDTLDKAGYDLVTAIADAHKDLHQLLLLVSSIIRPVNVIRGEDGLSPEGLEAARKTGKAFRDLIEKYEAGLSEVDE